MQDTSWTNKISTWNYTMTNTKTRELSGPNYSTITIENLYLHELNRNSKTLNAGEWKNLNTKISLMYASDYALSLGNDALKYTSSSNSSTMKTGWMHISNNDSGTPSNYEWTMSHYGKNGSNYRPWIVYSDGIVTCLNVNISHAVRPVFYLAPDVELSANSGDGSITNPYLIK